MSKHGEITVIEPLDVAGQPGRFDDAVWSRIKAEPGTYALVMSAAANASVRIGRLGDLRLRPGFYVYVGSALGPGGVRARLAHHIRPSSRPHWHIDYLKVHAAVEQVWYCHNRVSREHEWGRCLAAMRGASMPMPGFGASDCRCRSHLFFFGDRPSLNGFARKLRAFDQSHPSGLLGEI